MSSYIYLIISHSFILFLCIFYHRLDELRATPVVNHRIAFPSPRFPHHGAKCKAQCFTIRESHRVTLHLFCMRVPYAFTYVRSGPHFFHPRSQFMCGWKE